MKYIILSGARSGSTQLCHRLRDVLRYSQPCEYIGEITLKSSQNPFVNFFQSDSLDTNTLNKILDNLRTYDCVVSKISFEQLNQETKWLDLNSFNNLLVWRNDHLKRILSRETCINTGLWHIVNKEQDIADYKSKIYNRNLLFNLNRIVRDFGVQQNYVRFIKNIQNQINGLYIYEHYTDALPDGETEKFNLDYKEIFKNYDKIIDVFGDFEKKYQELNAHIMDMNFQSFENFVKNKSELQKQDFFLQI